MSKIGLDGLNVRERAMLQAARAGQALTAEQAAAILARLGGARRAWNLDEVRRRADAFDQVCEGFVVLHAAVERLEAKLDAERRSERRLQRELRRVKAERDDAQMAARDADGKRLALIRQLEHTG